jgi:hypothetical protein
MTATMTPVDWSFSSTDESPPRKPVIVGSGPAGLACAIMLAKRGWSNIQVYDRLGEPPAITSDEWKDAERSYLIGLNGRGQTALKALGVFDEVDALCADVTGRREWTPGSEESKDMDTSKKRGFKTKVIGGTKILNRNPSIRSRGHVRDDEGFQDMGVCNKPYILYTLNQRRLREIL